MRFHYILGMADKKSESDCKRLSADFALATPYSPPQNLAPAQTTLVAYPCGSFQAKLGNLLSP